MAHHVWKYAPRYHFVCCLAAALRHTGYAGVLPDNVGETAVHYSERVKAPFTQAARRGELFAPDCRLRIRTGGSLGEGAAKNHVLFIAFAE